MKEGEIRKKPAFSFIEFPNRLEEDGPFAYGS